MSENINATSHAAHAAPTTHRTDAPPRRPTPHPVRATLTAPTPAAKPREKPAPESAIGKPHPTPSVGTLAVKNAKTTPSSAKPHHHVPRGRHRATRQIVVTLTDTITVALTTIHYTRGTEITPEIAAAVAAGWLTLALLLGGYSRQRLENGVVGFRHLVALTCCGIGVASIADHVLAVPSTAYALIAVIAATLLAARLMLSPLATMGRILSPRSIVLVGLESTVRDFLKSNPRLPVTGACLIEATGQQRRREIGSIPTHPLAALAEVVTETRSSSAVIVDPLPAQTLRRLAWQLEPTGATLTLAGLWSVNKHRVKTRRLDATTGLEVSAPRRGRWRSVGIRVLDLVVALMGLVALTPLFVLIAIAIAIDSRGPVFYRQSRTGFGGTRFKVWKFRTMVADADAQKAALMRDNQYREGTLFKMVDDPRVTRMGRLLRRTSLDELPQLINVMVGQMALVGPRPTSTPPDKMAEDYRRRMLVKPGLTGLWQVSGRSNLSWSDSVRLDLHYVENHDFTMNLTILAKTIPAVLKRDGAY